MDTRFWFWPSVWLFFGFVSLLFNAFEEAAAAVTKGKWFLKLDKHPLLIEWGAIVTAVLLGPLSLLALAAYGIDWRYRWAKVEAAVAYRYGRVRIWTSYRVRHLSLDIRHYAWTVWHKVRYAPGSLFRRIFRRKKRVLGAVRVEAKKKADEPPADVPVKSKSDRLLEAVFEEPPSEEKPRTEWEKEIIAQEGDGPPCTSFSELQRS